MGFYMEIFEARVLGENLYLHQRFTQCSKWRNFIFGWNIENIFSSEFELI
jgi:hypothetical protein